ncbi:MAG: hypothetical protein JW860_07355 [Sedimentisphaerales bacterium]|nr:hypothetical protein [Sedimentisphaerales bacterium]
MQDCYKTTIQKRAFSIAELLLVLGIIMIFAFVATLNFNSNIDYAKVQNAAARLCADLRLVGDQARRDQKTYLLQINPGRLEYTAEGVTGLDGPEQIYVEMGEPPYEITSLSCPAITDNAVIFDLYGRATTPGQIIIKRGNKTATINIAEGGLIEQIE